MTVWLTARGAGLAALVLLTAATALGALVTDRGSAPTRVIVQHVHRVLSILGLGVLVLHVLTVLADSYAHVGVTGAVVPFTSGYRATAVGLGTIALYLALAAAAVGAARGRLAASARGAAAWRGVHGVGYAAWLIALVHGVTAGSDSGQGWVRVLYLGCVTTVGAAVTARLRRRPPRPALRETASVRQLHGVAR